MKFVYRKLAFALIVAVFLSSINLNVYTYKLNTLINTNNKNSVATLNNSSYSNTESYINNLNKNIDNSIHVAFAPSFGIQHSYAGGIVNAVGNLISNVVSAVTSFVATLALAVVSAVAVIATMAVAFVLAPIELASSTFATSMIDTIHGLMGATAALFSNLTDFGTVSVLDIFNSGFCQGTVKMNSDGSVSYSQTFFGGNGSAINTTGNSGFTNGTHISTSSAWSVCGGGKSSPVSLGFIPWTIDPNGTKAISAEDFDQGTNTYYGSSGLKTGFSSNGLTEKNVACAPGEFSVGVSWWQHPNGFDDENVRILCTTLSDSNIYPQKDIISNQLESTEVFTSQEPQTVDTGYPNANYQSCTKVLDGGSGTTQGVFLNFLFPFVQKAFASAPSTYYWECFYYQNVTQSSASVISTEGNHVATEYLYNIPAGNLVAMASSSNVDPSTSSPYFDSCVEYDDSLASIYSTKPNIWSQIQSYEISNNGSTNNLWICTTKSTQGLLFNFWSKDQGQTITEYSGTNRLNIQQHNESDYTIPVTADACKSQVNCAELLELNDVTQYQGIDNFFPSTNMTVSPDLPYSGIFKTGMTLYDEAACPPDYVATGLGVTPYGSNSRPWHLDLSCRRITDNSYTDGFGKLLENSGTWWQVPLPATICQNDTHLDNNCSSDAKLSAFSPIVGEKDVFCPNQEVMVGVRFANGGGNVDDEHVSIYCKAIKLSSSASSTPPQIFSK